MALRYSKNLSIIATFLSTNLWCSAFLLSSEIGVLRNRNHNKHFSTTDEDRKEGVTEKDSDNISPLSSSPPPSSSLLSKRLDGLDAPTVWHEFSPLAVKHKSINLGQGFPDWDPPRFVIEELKRSTDPEYNDANQYARSAAHLPLAEALRNDYVDYQWKESDLPTDILHNLDAVTNIATATGVTNVLYCALQGLVNPGDEVLLLEPYFDIYSSQVKLAGGTPIYCPLRSDISKLVGASEFFTLDLDELASKITTKTKVLILNTPHNPTGKIFNIDELEGIANLVSDYPNLIVLSDEVYQHLLFDKEKEPHISIATVNNGQIWDQTLTMSSAGKTFSCTGWKVGWAIGPAHLIKAITAVQQWCNFSPVTPTQDAISRALVLARRPYEGYDSYYDWLVAGYEQKRSILIDALENAGIITPAMPRMAVIKSETPTKGEATETIMPRDWALSRWLTTTVGVTAIPPSAFYGPDNLHLASNTLRFAFCKNEDTLLEASRRLEDYHFPTVSTSSAAAATDAELSS
ncbi:PLP-dependent transferase [Fragilariopsis cylindrus CCMP1102]|uniref:PLP-dependent transferase n=1 Tax=Fragilariopsis cylindrus CCMP1102 TaxID=635003 RepID=A0A1E7ESM9_9STRA|nr:PLP-dependent transferase [Fragilariopsis cylindrus CCMP1102]|eukprot:OEU08971.1 PLP-dependent transferase [Fragilariopsis cylindrus CCMP1102]